MENELYAKIAYEAYCQNSQWKSLVSGAALPVWEKVDPKIKAAWGEAAIAVLKKGAEVDFRIKHSPQGM